jgi:hypothetical protein
MHFQLKEKFHQFQAIFVCYWQQINMNMVSKGHLNSEWIYEVIFSQNANQKFEGFLPWKFIRALVGILGETMTS